MAPKGQSFEVPMRESKQLPSSKVSDRQRKRSLKKVPGKKTEEKPTEEEELDSKEKIPNEEMYRNVWRHG